MDKNRIDSHKLMLHPDRVARWLRGEDVGPIYMEVSPTGACNHRCVFCGLDYMGYAPRFLDADMLERQLPDMAATGLKSIMYAGEGEPLLHRDMVRIAEMAHAAGIDNAFASNGVLLDEERARRLLPITKWIKVSCNAGTAATHAALHGTTEEDFPKVIGNLARAVRLREELGSECTLGLQSLLLPENEQEMELLARTCRDIGLDYLVIKPYSQHPMSNTERYKDIRYGSHEELGARLEALSGPDFSVIFRWRTMQRWDHGRKGADRPYARCLGLPFWCYLDSRGDLWGCKEHQTDERFLYGNVNEQSFSDIWRGERRRENRRWVENELDPADCRINCRIDDINAYLWELKHPGEHVNFI